MRKIALSISVAAGLCFGSPSFADSSDQIRCVQGQLNELGFDAGPADGLWGQKTQGALEQYNASLDTPLLYRLRPDSAVIWCREIAGQDPDLQGFWPEGAGAHQLIFAGEVSDALKAGFDTALGRAVARSQEVFGTRMSDEFIFVVGRDRSALAREVYINRPVPYRRDTARRIVDSTCFPDGFGTRNIDDLNVVCLSDEFNQLPLSDFEFGRRSVYRLAHGVFKASIFQLIGYGRDGKFLPDVNQRVRGPRWMIEGFSALLADEVYTPTRSSASRRTVTKARWSFEGVELKDAISHRDYMGDPMEYLSMIAVLDLEKKAGRDAVLAYFRSISEGSSPDQAFQSAFGLSFEEFYDEFEL